MRPRLPINSDRDIWSNNEFGSSVVRLRVLLRLVKYLNRTIDHYDVPFISDSSQTIKENIVSTYNVIRGTPQGDAIKLDVSDALDHDLQYMPDRVVDVFRKIKMAALGVINVVEEEVEWFNTKDTVQSIAGLLQQTAFTRGEKYIREEDKESWVEMYRGLLKKERYSSMKEVDNDLTKTEDLIEENSLHKYKKYAKWIEDIDRARDVCEVLSKFLEVVKSEPDMPRTRYIQNDDIYFKNFERKPKEKEEKKNKIIKKQTQVEKEISTEDSDCVYLHPR